MPETIPVEWLIRVLFGWIVSLVLAYVAVWRGTTLKLAAYGASHVSLDSYNTFKRETRDDIEDLQKSVSEIRGILRGRELA